MRVQPHLPSRPLTAMVTDSDGFAACACNAANSPAPPEPRMSMSVRRRRMPGSGAGFHTQRRKHGRALVARFDVDRVVQAPATAVHGHAQRPEIANAKAPEALRIQVVEIDVLDRF